MPGRLQFLDNRKSRSLLEKLDIDPGDIRFFADRAPGGHISIIYREKDHNVAGDAVWWLLVDAATGKPNYNYATFTSRHDKLDSPKSIAYTPYRESRCIIPVTAFIEGEGEGNRRKYHKIELQTRAIAFGGLYRRTLMEETGDVIHSASIITLPPLDAWADIHTKSTPLMLPLDDAALINRWLAPSFHDVAAFSDLLQPVIRANQVLTPIGKPSQWNETGEPFIIPAGQ